MSAGFEILEHPADLGLRAWAPGIAQLFEECALALTDVLFDRETIQPAEAVTITVTGQDYEYLLYNWLSELLYFFDGEKLIFSQFRVLQLEPRPEGWCLHAQGQGEHYDAKRHQIKTYVKAITFHQLNIAETAGSFTALVYLDI